MMPEHYEKIVAGLKKLGTANYEKIAANIGLDRHQVGRRLKEMEGLQLVYKPMTTSLTTSGRNAYDYKLTEEGQKIEVKEVVYKKGEKSAAEYAGDMIKTIKKPIPQNQTPLFSL
jgi:predicted ArsR family transcriptional regulator